MIEVKHLSKKYGSFVAVDDVSFTVDRGKVIGFLGPNGAGKSTVMNIITGYISLTEGEVQIDGFDITRQPENAKRRIGYLPENPPLYPDMKVREYLNFIYDLKKAKYKKAAHIDEVMSVVGIDGVKNRLIKNLSKGYRQRVGLAQALIGNPDILILDEPTVGLDPKQIIEIRNLIKKLGENHTVIISSHILSEIQAVCEDVIIINKGKLVAAGNIDELSKKISSDNSLALTVGGDGEKIAAAIDGLEAVKSVRLREKAKNGESELIITPDGKEDIRSLVFDAVVSAGEKILYMSNNAVTLEQIFLMLTENSDNADAISLLKSSNEKEDEE